MKGWPGCWCSPSPHYRPPKLHPPIITNLYFIGSDPAYALPSCIAVPSPRLYSTPASPPQCDSVTVEARQDPVSCRPDTTSSASVSLHVSVDTPACTSTHIVEIFEHSLPFEELDDDLLASTLSTPKTCRTNFENWFLKGSTATPSWQTSFYRPSTPTPSNQDQTKQDV